MKAGVFILFVALSSVSRTEPGTCIYLVFIYINNLNLILVFIYISNLSVFSIPLLQGRTIGPKG